MKILHISAASKNSGAGYAALLTHNALIECGINSRILYLIEDIDPTSAVYYYTSNSIIKKLKRLTITTLDRILTWVYSKRKNEIFSPGFLGLNLRYLELFKWAEIIHIHWANHGFINIKEIKKWNKPVVWTLRDMWPFTGGCHVSLSCNKYQSFCGACPVLGSNTKQDLSSMVLKRKIKYLSGLSINWVAISTWMKTISSSSTVLKNKSIPVIYSGIDCNTFKIRDYYKARELSNFPYKAKIILIGANNIRERYKGFQYVINTLKKINKEYLVVTFGYGQINKEEIPQNIINVGHINNAKELATLYNSADVFFAPSICEAFGKTFAEAQACGLPVLCFDETGPADIVEHINTGYLAKLKDEDDLLKGLKYCLKANFDKKYISKRSKKLFDIHKTAKEYIKLYKNVLRGQYSGFK